MVVRFLDFSKFNGKPPQGSTLIRCNQLYKCWDEADEYHYGEKVDVMVFQKVYVNDDYDFPEKLNAIKILDLCDPDWFSGHVQIKRTIDSMDAVTCSSLELTKHVSQFTDKPVIHVPDRFDLEVIPKPQEHIGKAKNIVWFGYSHNAEALKQAVNALVENNLHLTVISNDDPIVTRWNKDLQYTYVKYDEDTIYQELQKHDIALLPPGTRAIDRFKSNNKTIKAQLAGLPVAHDRETLEKYIDPEERNKFIKLNHDRISKEYDVAQSVAQLKEIIDAVKR